MTVKCVHDGRYGVGEGLGVTVKCVLKDDDGVKWC